MNKIPKGIKCEVTPEVVYQYGVPPIPDGWEFASFDYPSADENWLCILPGAANIQFGKCPAPRIIVRPVPPKPTCEELEKLRAHEKAWVEVKHWQDRFDGAQAREAAAVAEATRLRADLKIAHMLDKASIKGVMGTYDPDMGRMSDEIAFTEEQLQCIERHYPQIGAYERAKQSREAATKPRPRRWIVEESVPLGGSSKGPHGALDVGGKAIPACIIRQMPITKTEMAWAVHYAHVKFDTLDEGFPSELLRRLGIQVEE